MSARRRHARGNRDVRFVILERGCVSPGRPSRRGRTAIGQDRFPYRQAVIYAALGDTESTFDALNRAIEHAAGARRGPDDVAGTGRLRDDPRYGAVRQRLNLP